MKDVFGGQYANEYVAQPGASEHQTGLGIDLTSQSVVEGKKITFDGTDEYKWVIKIMLNMALLSVLKMVLTE